MGRPALPTYPDRVFKRGAPHPERPGFVFRAYHKGVPRWIRAAAFRKMQECSRGKGYNRKPRNLWCQKRFIAAKLGIPFALPEDFFAKNPPPERCPILGIPLFRAWEQGSRKTNATDNSPSLDRIKPELGYVPGNVMWISQLANKIKQNATADQIHQVAKFLSSPELIAEHRL